MLSFEEYFLGTPNNVLPLEHVLFRGVLLYLLVIFEEVLVLVYGLHEFEELKLIAAFLFHYSTPFLP